MGYYARVSTAAGNAIHLAEVPYRNRAITFEGLHTLCGHPAVGDFDSDLLEDDADCKKCLAFERQHPKNRRVVLGRVRGLSLQRVAARVTRRPQAR